MDHFSEAAWTDFVRGIKPLGGSNPIESHLETGCAKCKAAFDLWSRVRSIAASELANPIPEQLVRRLKLEFASRYPSPVSQELPANLVFDSFLRPLAIGVRGGAMTARQLVYEAEGLTVDLRVEKEPQSAKVYAVVQVLDNWTPPTLLNQGTVILWTARGYPLLETKPNDHGECQLEFEAEDGLHLSIGMLGRNLVRVALPRLS